MNDAVRFMEKPNALILFDGVCNLCSASINFIIDRDPKGYFKFAPLQSEIGEHYRKEFGINEVSLDTIMLIEQGKLYTHSAAPLRIARNMSGAWFLCYGFMLVPRFIRDAVYKFVARNRYRWFGKQEACRIPTPELKARFLS